MERGQIFTWDLVFGISVFLMTLFIVTHVWNSSYNDLRHAEEEYEMNWLAETISEQLVRTAGDPLNWSQGHVFAFGLAEVKEGQSKYDSRVLDADKMLKLVSNFGEDYEAARNNLLGSSKYEIYIEFSCVNRSDLTCLQGLFLDEINDPVSCENYVIGVKDMVTSSYIWLEAEDEWGNWEESYCWEGCSGGNMSLVPDGIEADLSMDPGLYQMWARVVDQQTSAEMVVDGLAHPLHPDSVPGPVGWKWIGAQDLGKTARVRFEKTEGDIVDALLFTTDLFYDPSLINTEEYGNPVTSDKCVIGKVGRGRNHVTATKNAVFGMPAKGREVITGTADRLDKELNMKVVVWTGEELPAREMTGTVGTSSTTSTTLPKWIDCEGSPTPVEPLEECEYDSHSIDIRNITLWGLNGMSRVIRCGSEKNLTVKWRGKHSNHPNYFAFYLDDSQQYLGSCQSDNTAEELMGEVYDYVMNCTIDIPDGDSFPVKDGYHDFIVTGEDYAGYCPPSPGEFYADDEESTRVDVTECMDYTSLSCSQTSGVALRCGSASGTVEEVYDVEVSELNCGFLNQVVVRWGGTHGADKEVYWTFVVDTGEGFKCLGTCKSSVDPEDGPGREDYEMTCDLNLNNLDCLGDPYNIEGDYWFYAIAESDNRDYCSLPNSPDAEAVGRTGNQVTVNCILSGSYVLVKYYVDVAVATGSELWTDTSGTWEVTATVSPLDPPTEGEHMALIDDIEPGVYEWNIKLSPEGVKPLTNDFLYDENQELIVE
ncbi:MAG: hypothetical protein GF416_05395 [Candidatus Altiarchaeales archaeon]|nr:hypothetical protein [Candidatus Altiarchaeales archaeon]MBD3416552.1 hypothetical protein [Candidatus Altiarchaeales archaeon]